MSELIRCSGMRSSEGISMEINNSNFSLFMLNMLCNPKIKAVDQRGLARVRKMWSSNTTHERTRKTEKVSKSEARPLGVGGSGSDILTLLTHIVCRCFHSIPEPNTCFARAHNFFSFLLCCVLPTRLLLTSLSVSFYMLNMQEAKFR